MFNQSGSRSSSQLSAQLNTLLHNEQCSSLYGNLPSALLLSLIIASILSISHWPQIGHAEIILWNLLLGASLIVRLLVWLFWHYARYAYSSQWWLQLFRVGVALTGIAWGSATYFLFAPQSALHQALLAFAIAGVASGSLTSLTLDRWSALTFVACSVFPLSLALYRQQGSVAMYMLVLSLLFMVFVINSTNRARRATEERLLKNIELSQLSKELSNKQLIENIIKAAQEAFIAEKNSQAGLKFMLQQLLQLSNSSLGFIGQVTRDAKGAPYMKSMLFAGDKHFEQKLPHYFATSLPEHGEFHNLNNLFGAAMESGKPIISNNPQRDMRAGGLPPQHPKIHSFMALPIFIEQQQIALLGLANKSQGYDEEDIIQLDPIRNTIAQLVQAAANEEDHAKDKAALVEHSLSTRIMIDNVSDGIIMIDKQGIIQEFNSAAEIIFGHKKSKVLHKNVSMLMPEPDKSRHDGYIANYLKTHKSHILGKGREVTGLRKNGETFPMDLMVSMVIHNDEPLFIGIVRDNSDKSKWQEQKNQLLRELLLEMLQQHWQAEPQGPLPASTNSNSYVLQEQLYKTLLKHLIKDNGRHKNSLPLKRSLSRLLSHNSALFVPHKVLLSSQDKNESLWIDCDELLFDMTLLLLLHFWLQHQPGDIEISLREYQNRAQICLLGAQPAVAASPLLDILIGTEQQAANSGKASKHPAHLGDLLGFYGGRIYRPQQQPGLLPSNTLIELEFPLSIASDKRRNY